MMGAQFSSQYFVPYWSWVHPFGAITELHFFWLTTVDTKFDDVHVLQQFSSKLVEQHSTIYSDSIESKPKGHLKGPFFLLFVVILCPFIEL